MRGFTAFFDTIRKSTLPFLRAARAGERNRVADARAPPLKTA